MKILIVGDVVSKLGRQALEENIKRIKQEQTINFIIVNGENISHGKGMNINHYKWLMSLGVNVVTMGNHTFNNKQIYELFDNYDNIVRPLNYKEDKPGKGYVTINYNGIKITIFQVIGNTFMEEGNYSLFEKANEFVNNIDTDILICDIHAEATSEKIAFGYYMDGKVDVVFGTHTHVQTSDERILPNGTAYITDVGMTGALNGVIGTKKDIIVNRFVNNKKDVFAPEDDGPMQFNAIIIEINDSTHKVTHIDRIKVIK
ncbi:MAG: TIGR00282 family metallophosphoesterase [Acholeplasmataceae bacterium]|nr:TIGR00282 family metallophosphoesterase [Acholeplasmataceae bacterium]